MNGRRLLLALAAFGFVLLPSRASALRFSQKDVARVDALLSAIRQRLVIAPEVARAKWSAGRPVDDPAREKQIIDGVTVSARDYAVDPRIAAAFFQGQIEASKVVQRALYAEWASANQPAFDSAADLGRDVRPELDRLTPALLRTLSEALPILARPGGRQLLTARGKVALAGAPGGDAAIRAALSPLQAVCVQQGRGPSVQPRRTSLSHARFEATATTQRATRGRHESCWCGLRRVSRAGYTDRARVRRL